MVRREFAESRADEHERLIAALMEACRFCDSPENRERIIDTLAGPEYLNVSAQALRRSFSDTFDFGHGRIEKMNDFHIFSQHDANEPDARKAAWLLEELIALLPDPSVLDRNAATRCFRPDIFQQATQLTTST
jgi:ABC-type nitrate/sulfonate/bicarbonate transport system substrate-binding protein